MTSPSPKEQYKQREPGSAQPPQSQQSQQVPGDKIVDMAQPAENLDKDPSLLDAAQVATALETSLDKGLTSAEAAHRLEKFGHNELESAPPVPTWKKLLNQFRDPLVYLLLAATLISLIAWFIERAVHPGEGEAVPFDAIVIVLILIVNAVLGYLQEAKAEQAVDALAKMSAPTTSVLRDGQVSRVATADIVPGDVLVLGEGDTVSADGRLFASASLRIAEASLTGESVPVAKSTGTLTKAKALGDRTNMIFNGTSVTQGTGRGIVTGTGMNTQVGKIADMLSQTKDEATPLEKEISHVSKLLGIAVCGIAVLVIVVLAITQGFHSVTDVIDSLLLAVSLAVAAVPEGLATIMTVVLALGVQRMAKHHAIVKKLSSVETLGSASVICSDKTGTLTRNEMTVETVVTPSGETKITGTGYAPHGQLVGTDGNDIPAGSPLPREVSVTLGVGALVNDAELREVAGEKSGDSRWEIIGDPTEASLVVAARKVKASKHFERYERVAEVPFTSDRKRMSTIAADKSEQGKLAVFSKGAPDVLLDYCDRIYVGGHVRPLTEGDRQEILSHVERLSSNAYRTLGQAYRPLEVNSLGAIPGVRSDASGDVIDIAEQDDVIEQHLIWAGMVGIIDPPRTEVRDSVAEAHRAGIRTVMITGDHPLTATRIASDLGIVSKGAEALTGDELDELSEAELDKKTAEVSVYARVAPEHKLKIVNSLQRQDNIVAMTGDGVNDAPAVKTADIGVAMGITGTEVTKEASKMILADDNFSTIVAAVKEGRGIFDNIRKFLRFLLSSNVGEVFTVFGGVIFAGFLGITQPGTVGITVPLLATQLLWINLLTDAAPALAMGVDNQTEDVMNRGPRKSTERVIDREMWGDIVYVGIIMAVITLIGMDMHLAGGMFTDRSVSNLDHAHQMVEARTMGFTILVFAQLFNALASRSAHRSVFHDFFTNKWLWGAIAISIILQCVVIYVPFLNTAFGTVPLSFGAWIECILLSSVVLWATEIRKIWLRAGEKKRVQPTIEV